MRRFLLPAIFAMVVAIAIPPDTVSAQRGGGKGGGGARAGGGGARMGGGGGARMGGGGARMSGGGGPRMSAPRMSSGPRISSGGGGRIGGSAPRISSGGGPRVSGAPRVSSGGAPRISSGSAPRVSSPGRVNAPRISSGSAPRISGSAPRVSGGSPRISSEGSPRAAGGGNARVGSQGSPRITGRADAGATVRSDATGRPTINRPERSAVSGQARGNLSPRGSVDRAPADRVQGAARSAVADRGRAAADRGVARTSLNRPQVDRVNDFLGMRGRGEGSANRVGSAADRARGTFDRPSWSRDVRTSQVRRVSERLAQANLSPVLRSASTQNWLSANPARARYWNNWAGGIRTNWNLGGYYGCFTPRWWAVNNVYFPWRHNYYWWGARPWSYWWGWPTWGGICNWYGGWGWNDPCYYDYGYGGNVIYLDRYVYVNGNPVATAEDYALSAAELAATPPSPDIADEPGEWLALGTFVIATSKDEVDPPRVIQLATDKEGNVSGTMVNKTTNKTYPVQGRVDKQTQRAAFTIGDNKDVVLETGIYNLTQQETPVLVHQGTDRTETYVLIRLEEPKEEERADGDKVESLLP